MTQTVFIDATKEPIFEIREVLAEGYGRTYRIWADGRIEGFEGRHIVLNHIGVMSDYLTAMARESVNRRVGEHG